jgi:hypothetical protein
LSDKDVSHKIPVLLKIFAWASVGLATGFYVVSLWSDIYLGSQYFARAGALSVFLVVLLFFVSQATGFFTFISGDNIDNMNHVVQRNYLTPFEGYLLVTGTFVWGFGDWIVNIAVCRDIACSS